MSALQGYAIRALDANRDWTFGNGTANYLQGNKAVAQRINSDLLGILGECFWNTIWGINWFGFLGSKNPKGLTLAIQQTILNMTQVTGIKSTQYTLTAERAYSVNWKVQTVYSTTPLEGNT